MLTDQWCRTCGNDLIAIRQNTLEGTTPAITWTSPLMQCLTCLAPGFDLNPDAKRTDDRILFHLLTKGVVRVGFQGFWHPRADEIDVMTNAAPESVRNYIGSAVTNLKKAHRKNSDLGPVIDMRQVATHVHKDLGYVVGHLKDSYDTCHCRMT